MKKHYINSNTSEHTESATVAMMWYRTGKTVQVNTFTEKGLVKVVHVHGVAQQKNDENYNHCESIGLHIQEYIDGRVYKCPVCDEIIVVPDNWSGEKYKCPDCKTMIDGEDLEQQTLYDYFEDSIFDIEYRVGSNREYRSARVMVACGGPNIYIDTKSGCVELYWWTESAKYYLMRDAINELDNFFEELFNC